MDKLDEPGGAFDQGADGRGPVLADDQVPLPVSGHRPVLRLGGPLADQRHGMVIARLTALCLATRLAHRAARAQRLHESAPQATVHVVVDSLIDRFVADVLVPIVGNVPTQPRGDLLGTQPTVQLLLDEPAKLVVADNLPCFRPSPPGHGPIVGSIGPILPVARMSVPAHLPTDRRRVAAQLICDHTDPGVFTIAIRDPDPLLLTQIPRARLGTLRQSWLPVPPLRPIARCCRAVTPSLTGSRVHTHDPAGLLAAVSLCHKIKIGGPFPCQLLTPLRRPVPADLEHPAPCARVLRQPLEPKPPVSGGAFCVSGVSSALPRRA